MGTERILIEVTEQGARVVQGRITDIGKSARESHSGIDALKRALLGLGAGFTLGAVINTMTSFSREMARVQVATGATKQQFDALAAAARTMGAETGAGADAAARALGILAREGLASAESTGALRDALRLASATGSDAVSTTTALANIMQAFQIDAEGAGRAVDILALASAKSAGGFEELGAGVLRVSAAAKSAGLDLADAAALVSVLNDAGLEGRIAVSELRGALEELETPTAKTRATFVSLGLDLEKLKPSAVGLSTVLDELGKRDVKLESLGIRGGRALDILAERIPDVRELLGELENATGTADKFAEVMESSLAGAFDKLGASTKNLALAFGGEGGLAASIRLVADAINGLAGGVAAISTQTQTFFELLIIPAEHLKELEKLRIAERLAAAGGGRAPLPGGETAGRGIIEIGGPDLVQTFSTRTDRFPDRSKKAAAEEVETLRTATEAEIIRVQVTDELVGARERLRSTEEALFGLLAKNLITQEQYNTALARATLENQAVADSMDVLKAKFLEIDISAQAIAASVGDSLVGAIDAASGALADFAISGFKDVESLKKALSDLLADLGKQILQLIIKMLILKAIEAGISALSGGVTTSGLSPAGGGVGAGATGALSGISTTSFGAGGGVEAGRPVVVGDRGPEIFTPPTSGHIIPNSQIGGAAPQVNVKILNVQDKDEVTSAMNSPAGEEVIMNTLAKNREALRQVLGGS